MVEHDPLTVSLEQVARAAGASRPLVHNYFGDRRGLLDALHVRLVRRLADWVDHGLRRAHTPEEALTAVVSAVFSFVEQQRDSWSLLTTSGGLDHPDLHAVRARWASDMADDDLRTALGAQAAIAALVMGVGGWAARGEDPGEVAAVLTSCLRADRA